MSTALAIDLQDFARRELADRVATTVDDVRRRGDLGLAGAARGGAVPTPLRLTSTELDDCLRVVSAAALDDVRVVQDQLERFAVAQRAALADHECDGSQGISAGARHVPVASVGICLPTRSDRGLAISAAQAGAVAARVAGVDRVVACVPPARGRIDELLVAALVLAGVDEIYRCGGAGAFAALRFGTETISRVELVYSVADSELEEADRLIEATAADRRGGRGLLIIADDDADAELVAADLIAAGECGADARGVLISISPALGARVAGAVERQLAALGDHDRVRSAWRLRGAIQVVGDREAACVLADRHAFARVEVMARDPRWYLERLRRCSVVLLGAGAGIVLADVDARRPAAAVWAPSVNAVSEFLRPISYRAVDRCPDGGAFARQRRLAGLEAHARACELRALRPAHPGREAARAAAPALG